MIQCTNITKGFPGFRLKPLSFELPDGYLCGLVGQNGSGKTTLLHLLLGLYHTEDGELSFDGKNYDVSEKEIRDSIGTVLTEELLNKGLSLEKNGDYYGRLFSNYKK
ncbi:MAG: ATP-binding cassette domain-containing protein, partial [Lachnospiraceae bacterium]|nr:ATP-binding cassette domain-containing protein [Lachnospiraceae bacterium]